MNKPGGGGANAGRRPIRLALICMIVMSFLYFTAVTIRFYLISELITAIPRKFSINFTPRNVLPPKKRYVIAYCTYPQKLRLGEPVLGSEYMARYVGPHVFPDAEVEIKPCLAVTSQLPRNVSATSREGLELLGLLGVHIRFCSFGVTALLEETFEKLTNVMHSHQQQFTEQVLSNVTTPNAVYYFVSNANDKPVGPLLVRMCREPHMELSYNVPLQLDTKAVNHSRISFSIHMPYAYESFGRARWDGGEWHRNHTFDSHYENYGLNNLAKLEDSITRSNRSEVFDIRNEHRHFAAMINSNCLKPSTSIFRGLFSFAVYSTLHQPVHNLGVCPPNPRGAIKAGLTVDQRKQLRRHYGSGERGWGISASEIFTNYKFAICFENSDVEGYVSEKIVAPYVGRAIPVYWGGSSKLGDIVNKKAIVHCDLPSNLTQYWRRELINADFSKLPDTDKEKWEDNVYASLLPHFQPCLDHMRYLDMNSTAYDEIRREPLALVQAGKLFGVWDESRYGSLMRSVFDYLGYEQASEELTKVL